ncbi:TetR/AcrR family transcriptional regulator [Planococcus sp. CAU13]|uniref:TetR/AcrR family transcriptional regulator n=1 Tax=Planococcus sp. CAU13 TaxID=1541197 RepID=UPI00052FF97F|nr:TetR/AcrR family transcriptional regulator C-terminal domain-containing protein [Planococcus sp. CAU13]
MKTDLRVSKTKEALREALLNLLKQKSLNSISVTELCQAAKVNRGTFYAHYGQVENLFEDYFRTIMKDLADSYQEPYRYVPSLLSKDVNPVTIRIFHHIEKYQPFYRIVFSKTVPLSYYYLLFDEVQNLIKNDVSEHYNTDIDISMLSAYQANAILGLAIEWHRQDFRQSAEEMNRLLVRFLSL